MRWITSTRRPGGRAVGFLALTVLALNATFTHAQTQTVTVTGRAAGTDLKAKDEAQRDAKRAAVEQACGVQINAFSQAEDFALKKDRILSHAAGYITEFRILREWTADDLSHCEVRATVSVGKFEVDFKAMFEHLREDMGNPRCVVIITEDNDVDDHIPPRLNGVCQSKIENYFLQHNVQLVDKGVIDEVQKRDMELAVINEDLNRLAARAASFGADVLVLGRAEAKYAGSVPLGHVAAHRWNMTLNVRVVQADTGQVLASNTYQPERAYTSTTRGNSDRGLAMLADEVAEKVLRDVADAWRKRLTSHQIFRVDFEGCSRSDARRLILPALQQARGVQQGAEGARILEVVNNVVSTQIYWAYDLDTLADTLEELPVEGMGFEVLEQSANRLRVKVVPGP